MHWMLTEFRETTIKSQLGHLQIVRPGYHDTGKANPFSFLLPADVPDLSVENPHQIKTVAPRLSFVGLISHGDSTLSFIGDGVAVKEQAVFGNALQVSAGQNLSPDDPKGIIVGEGLARNLGVNVGESVILLANTASGGINAIEVTIRGLFSTVTKSYDDFALRIPIDTARQLVRTTGSHVWAVLLTDTDQTDAVLQKLLNRLPSSEFEIVPWYKLADFYNKTATLFAKQIQGLKFIIAVIIVLSISNTMTTNVMLRTGEIGTSLALGVKRAGIIRMFLSEGVLLGVFGAFLGLAVGLISAVIITSIGIPMPPPPGMVRGYVAEVLVTREIALESVTLALSTTLLASFYPAWKASRLPVVAALRHNR
jgi:putative ABC transport system permease protein